MGLGLLIELQERRRPLQEVGLDELHLVEHGKEVELADRGSRGREGVAGPLRKELLELGQLRRDRLRPELLVLLGAALALLVVARHDGGLELLHQGVEVLALREEHLRHRVLGVVLALSAREAPDVVDDRDGLPDVDAVGLQKGQLSEGRLPRVLQLAPLCHGEARVAVALPLEAGELRTEGGAQALGQQREVGQGHAALAPGPLARGLGRRHLLGPARARLRPLGGRWAVRALS
mmetsp:Transcript_17361/g.39292  ORF Transcript_17361/g.39292 Transcript_17361/m.39292 type:complete len:235 (+) Transcript_17361:263-967(+)